MIKYIIPLMLLGLALSSYADPPTGGASGKSGCYTVSGALDGTGSAVSPLSGAITGDIEGTFANAGATHTDFRGIVQFSPLTQTWEITGGIVEPLNGETVVFENEFVGVFAQWPLIFVNTRMRVEYHGVICPYDDD